ncbi:hydrogenase maturation nickel metallochaperone HypA [Streptomyces aidingensis]|uniref:Hydrogenase maturation factor HypA n=1 Tax=Streptomyces aidingensis TaxID=910347 RepID=A0A1I1V7R6_9ACTN|nr:hydrogenase maturation nickel metallochaperone HypA [Streptomyces aidingensis]SFD79081.1 hydrogenase nickel incorporation protein HypA/HybF [Streptomyces aidingensis]
MHELSIAAAVAERAGEVAREHDAAGVAAVLLRVGELAGVVPDALRFSFGLVTEGTPAAGAALLIEEVPARARCGDCGERFAVGSPPSLCCPRCGRAAAELLTGRELELAEVRLTDPARDACHPGAPTQRAETGKQGEC